MGCSTVLAPVRYEVEPERIVGVGVRMYQTDREGVEALLKQGLRATLQSASLITGQQQRVRARFPATPIAALALLPTVMGNPDGARPISVTI